MRAGGFIAAGSPSDDKAIVLKTSRPLVTFDIRRNGTLTELYLLQIEHNAVSEERYCRNKTNGVFQLLTH